MHLQRASRSCLQRTNGVSSLHSPLALAWHWRWTGDSGLGLGWARAGAIHLSPHRTEPEHNEKEGTRAAQVLPLGSRAPRALGALVRVGSSVHTVDQGLALCSSLALLPLGRSQRPHRPIGCTWNCLLAPCRVDLSTLPQWGWDNSAAPHAQPSTSSAYTVVLAAAAAAAEQ